MKTVLAGLFALFLFFSWHPQPVSAACCDASSPSCRGILCGNFEKRCDKLSECAGAATTPGTSPRNGAAPGTNGQPPAASAFDPFKGCSNNEVNTALGCIPTEPSGFIKRFLDLGIGIAGGIAFLLILFGGFQILTSAGNPEKLNAGKELVGSAVTGLLLIIFSVFLLRVIGINILGIPEFK